MGGIFLEIVQPGDDGSFEILFLSDERSADPVVFDVIPDELIGIEFWTVGRQKEQVQFVLNPFQEGLYLFGPVSRMGIDDEKDFSLLAVKETLQELQKDGSVCRFFGDHESDISPGRDGRDHVEAKSLTG